MSATVAEKNAPLTPISSAASHNETRADIACLICRSRKVRCDKTLPECRNCIRLGVPCPRYSRDHEFISRKELQKSAEDIFKAAGVEKRRVGSCEECRSSKHRCTKTRPSCRRCILRNLPCVYPSRSDRDPAPSTPSGSKQLQASERSPYANDSQASPTYPPQNYAQFQQPLPQPYKPHHHEPPPPQHYPQQHLQHHQRNTSHPENYQVNHYPPNNAYTTNETNRTHHQSPVHQSAPQFTSYAPQHHPGQQHQHQQHQQHQHQQHQPPQQPLSQPPIPPQRQPNPYIQPNGHEAKPLIPRTVPDAPSALGPDLERLYSDTLPNDVNLQRRLLEVYFERSAPLRVMSFIHKPSFMQSFDRASVAQDYGEPLLYAMCALGARHIFFDYVAGTQGASSTVDAKRIPGEAWAERARQEVLREIHAPTIHHIMTMVLLCDYGQREDRNAMVFVLIAFLYRMIRLLSLDDHRKLENPTSPAEFLQRECEIRLVWACYYVDVMVGTGVEKNLCWRDDVPNIPLPCPEPNFLSQTPSTTFFVENIERAGFAEAIPQLDLEALSILVVRLRSKVMKLIRKPQSNKHIWENESQFIEIINRLDIVYQNLPEKYHLSDLNMYVLKDKGILGGVFVLHLLIHAVIFDLTRTSLAGFNFPMSADFKHAPDDFRTQCQDRCRFHADQVSQLIRKAMNHGRSAFDDVFCADAAMESAKIQIVYAATVNRVPQIVSATRSNLCTNIEFLKSLNRSTETKNQVIRALLPICTLFGFRDIAEKYHEPSDSDQADTAAEVTGSADMHHLSRLAAFRRGRSELQQGAHSTSSPRTASSNGSHASPLIHAGGKAPPRSATSNPVAEYSTNGMPIISGTFGAMAPSQQDGAPTTPGATSMPTQRHPLQLMPSAGVMVQNGAILQPSIDDYIKTADEMSNLLTWNMPDLPPWMSYGDVMLPG